VDVAFHRSPAAMASGSCIRRSVGLRDRGVRLDRVA
jgi:hypothetical protein